MYIALLIYLLFCIFDFVISEDFSNKIKRSANCLVENTCVYLCTSNLAISNYATSNLSGSQIYLKL